MNSNNNNNNDNDKHLSLLNEIENLKSFIIYSSGLLILTILCTGNLIIWCNNTSSNKIYKKVKHDETDIE